MSASKRIIDHAMAGIQSRVVNLRSAHIQGKDNHNTNPAKTNVLPAGGQGRGKAGTPGAHALYGHLGPDAAKKKLGDEPAEALKKKKKLLRRVDAAGRVYWESPEMVAHRAKG